MTGRLSRRGLLTASAAGVGVAALAACSNEGRGGAQAEGSPAAPGASVLPTYIPYAGVEPDLVGEHGVADAFFAYPGSPVRAIETSPGDGEPIRTMGYTNSPIPSSVENNEFWRGLNERLGSALTINLSTTGDYGQKFPTTVAGGQLPDVWVVGSAPQLPQLLAAEALDLTAHLAGDAVADYPHLANIPTDSWRAAVHGGAIRGVPVPRGVNSTFVLYARDDLLAGHGIAEGPSSYEDFVDMCREVTDPRSNRWALARVPLDYVRQMHGIPNAWERAPGGRLVSAFEHEAQQDALEATRKLGEEGLLNPDSFTAKNQDFKLWFAGGSALFNWDTFSAWPGYFELWAGEDFSLTAFGPPGVDGGDGSAWLGNPTHNITAINKNAAERAETLLQFLNFLASPFGTEEYKFCRYGVEGVHHTLEGTDPILTDKGRSEVQLGLLYLADAPWPIHQPGNPDGTRAQFDAQMAVIPGALANPVVGLYSETDSRLGGQLRGDLANLQNDILQGREPVSAWAGGVEDWKRKGGDRIRDEFQAALEEAQ